MISRVHRLLLCGLVAVAVALTAPGQADQGPTTRPAEEPLSVEEIVNRTNRVSYYQGADGRAQVWMTIVDAQGRKRRRQMTILRWDQPDPAAATATQPRKKKTDEFCGEQKFYVYFSRPPDVNKMAFLVWKHLDKDDDRWLYLPALDLVKRISSADKRTSFVGSHFFYEDVSGRNINADKHELLRTTKNYYVLKNTPKDPKTVEFAHFTMWIHRKTFVVVKTDYFDARGRNYRRYQALKVATIQGYPTVTKSRMTDLRTKGYTDLEYKDVKYDLNLPESIFAERYLRKAPREYLK